MNAKNKRKVSSLFCCCWFFVCSMALAFCLKCCCLKSTIKYSKQQKTTQLSTNYWNNSLLCVCAKCCYIRKWVYIIYLGKARMSYCFGKSEKLCHFTSTTFDFLMWVVSVFYIIAYYVYWNIIIYLWMFYQFSSCKIVKTKKSLMKTWEMYIT